MRSEVRRGGSPGASRPGAASRPRGGDSGGRARGPERKPARHAPRIGPGVEFSRQQWPDVSTQLARQDFDLLIPHVLRAGAEAVSALERLKRYGEMVLQWNRMASNLISRNDEARLVTRHMLESIEPAPWLKSLGAEKWIDFGSGGGFPAIPLIIVGVGTEWLLVESRRTKCLFLKKVVQELGLSNVRVEQARLEDLLAEPAMIARFDAFTSRATQTLVPTLLMAAQFVHPGGEAFLWKGSRREEEMARDKNWNELWELDGLLGIGDGLTVVSRFTRR